MATSEATEVQAPSKRTLFENFVKFKVKGEIFTVPSRPFQEQSETFTSIFHLPQGETVPTKELEEPVSLKGVQIDAFRAFLEVMFMPCYLEPSLEKDEWLSVLDLAHKWGFTKLKASAVENLNEVKLPTLEILRLAKVYDLPQWTRLAIETLITQEIHVTDAECEQIGWRLAVHLGRCREDRVRRRARHGITHSTRFCPYTDNCKSCRNTQAGVRRMSLDDMSTSFNSADAARLKPSVDELVALLQ